VTAKGNLKSPDSARTFRLHLAWAAIATVLLIVSFRFHHDYMALRVWGILAVITGLGPPLIVMASRLGRGGRAMPGAPSALVPYDSAWVPYDVRIPRRAAPASPVQQTRIPRGIRPAERLAAHESRHRAAMLPPLARTAGERPAYRGGASELPAYGVSVHGLPAQPAGSGDAW
jgi:hypothetical protein